MKTLFLESIAGIAGDMFAASFVDSGLINPEELLRLPVLLGLIDVNIKISKVIRATQQATHIGVTQDVQKTKNKFIAFKATPHSSVLGTTTSPDNHNHTPYLNLKNLLLNSALETKTKNLAIKIFENLADAESRCHGIKKEEISFHEVGTVDSLLDVVMAAYCIDKVGADNIISTPVKLGRGFIKIQHGTHPVPPPGSAALVIGMPIDNIPTSITRENVELSTPTGLAILKTLNPSFSKDWPQGKVVAQGSGAGTMDLGNHPNLFRVSLFETSEKSSDSFLKDSVFEIKTNLDDMSAEKLSWVCEKLLEIGALDVWQSTAVGKKGRVIIILSLLTEEPKWRECADFVLKNTTSFGLRYRVWDRLKLERKFEVRETDSGPKKFKVGYDTRGNKLKEKQEYEDIKKYWNSNSKP
jgi:uncharacterized protein (TIGR00299 family) protein